MVEPRPKAKRIAAAIVRQELERDDNFDRVTVRLHENLAKLIGSGGFDILLGRSLRLATARHPVLTGVVAHSGGVLSGLNEPERDQRAVEDAVVAVVSYFVELLDSLIGEDLTMRLLHEVWPEPPDGGVATREEETP